MKRIVGLILIALVSSINAYAQDQVDNNEIKFSCKKDTTEDSKFFPEIQMAARKLNQAICDSILAPTSDSITDGFPKDQVTSFGMLVNRNASYKFEKVNFDIMNEQLKYFEETLSTGELYPKSMPILNVIKGATGPRDKEFYSYFTGNTDNQIKIAKGDNEKCLSPNTFEVPCSSVLKDLNDAIYPYQHNANAYTAFDTRVKLTALAKDWDSYFETARAQTFADITITTWFEKRHFKKDYLVGPPERQWFILHPNIALEFVDGAPDGEKFKAALYIEWIAVNWWKDSFIGIPFGVSLSSIYSDRPDVEGIGHGVTLNFDNKYVIGYSNHDGEHGFYVSLDVLKLFENKKKQANRYREQIKVLLPNIN